MKAVEREAARIKAQHVALAAESRALKAAEKARKSARRQRASIPTEIFYLERLYVITSTLLLTNYRKKLCGGTVV